MDLETLTKFISHSSVTCSRLPSVKHAPYKDMDKIEIISKS